MGVASIISKNLTKSACRMYTHFVQNEFEETATPASPYPPKEPATNPSAQTYEYGQPPRKRSPKKLLFLAVGVILLIVVILNILRLLGSNEEVQTPTPTPSIEDFAPSETTEPTPEPTEEPTPTPASSVDAATGLDRADLSVIVQNGSGTAGAAGEAAELLRDLGYNVVSTGNADNFDYEDVTIRVKSSEKDYLPLLNKDLSDEYSIGDTSSDLSATSSADAIVIIGAE